MVYGSKQGIGIDSSRVEDSLRGFRAIPSVFALLVNLSRSSAASRLPATYGLPSATVVISFKISAGDVCDRIRQGW